VILHYIIVFVPCLARVTRPHHDIPGQTVGAPVRAPHAGPAGGRHPPSLAAVRPQAGRRLGQGDILQPG
jgi:hypothetical protein